MKIIALEEHHLDADVAAASPASPIDVGHTGEGVGHTGEGAGYAGEGVDRPAGASATPTWDQLLDLDEGRIADMDRHHVDVQVLSCLTTRVLAPDVAVDLVRAMVMGRTQGQFLSAPRFEPVLATAARLRVPVHLHPGVPPADTFRENYGGLAPAVSARFGTSAWGWHTETAVHFLHLVLSGALDRHPDLQLVLGHWGEMIPSYLDRLDDMLPRAVTGLDRTVGEYVRQNVFVTPSGLFTQANPQYCVEVLGVDRIAHSVDHPFVGEHAESFLRAARISDGDRDAVAHGTADRLLGL